MKLKELCNLLDMTLEVIEKKIEGKKSLLYIFNINIYDPENNTTMISVNATSWIGYKEEAIKFIYSTLTDLEDIEWVEYHRYDTDKDLYYFGVEFKNCNNCGFDTTKCECCSECYSSTSKFCTCED